jgi:hypothetical protein
MPIQGWKCVKCRAIGTVFFEEHEGVVEVVNKIADDHRRKSPRCTQTVDRIRCSGVMVMGEEL